MFGMITENRLYSWLQTNMYPMAQTVLVMTILGYVPSGRMIGIPFLLGYALLKRRAIVNAIDNKLRDRNSVINNPSIIGERIADFFRNHPISVFKNLFALFLLLSMGISSWSMVMLYGIYRFSNDEWKEKLETWIDRIYHIAAGFFTRFFMNVPLKKKLIAVGLFTTFLALTLYFDGVLQPLLSLGCFVFTSVIIATGFSAIFRDIKYALTHPLKVYLDHPGKWLGVMLGRSFAYKAIAGNVDGVVGPAVGYVVNHGVFSGIISSFLSPIGGFFASYSLWQKLTYFLNPLFTSIFLTTEMQTQGNFYGVIGPSSLQIYAFMLIGCLVGYGVERFADSLCTHIANDTKTVANHTAQKITSVHNRAHALGYISKWHIGFATLVTPFIMLSSGGPQIIAMAGGSLLWAGALAAAGLLAGIAGFVTLGHGCKAAYRWLLGRNRLNGTPALAVQAPAPVQIPAPVAVPVIPAFTEHMAQSRTFVPVPEVVDVSYSRSRSRTPQSRQSA